MAEEDRKVWNQRYLDGAYSDRTYPSEILQSWLHLIPNTRRRALDVACGTGRNARFLAESGFESVLGVDISDIAIQKALSFDSTKNLPVNYQLHDLDQGLSKFGKFDFIAMIRFVDRGLIAAMDQSLNEGGCVLLELHMKYEGQQQLAGPRTNRYRVEAGEVQQLISHLEILRDFEGLITDPDGRRSAVVRVLARNSRAKMSK